MRIALLTDAWLPQVNGVVRTLTETIGLLQEWGHEVLVVHPGLFKRTVALPRYPEVRLSVFPGRDITRLLEGFRPDTIHVVTEGTIGLTARRYCLSRRLPFTTSFHTHFAKYGRHYFFVPLSVTYRLMRWFHGAAERTLVPTQGVLDELVSQGFDPRKLVVWTRGVDTSVFRPHLKSDFEPYAHLPRPVYLYCGRIAREKNTEAFLDMRVDGSKVAVGDGPERDSLQRKYPEAVFVGYKHGEDLAQHFSGADVFVFPSRTDTFGVVMLEAMACGLPVAAYPVTGPIDVVRQGVTGILDENLAEASRRALSLEPQDCRDQAIEYSWEKCARAMLENLAIATSQKEAQMATL